LLEEQRAVEEEAVSYHSVVQQRFEWLPEPETDGRELMFDGRINGGYFLEYVNVVDRKIVDPA
jgi:hypothetical protein